VFQAKKKPATKGKDVVAGNSKGKLPAGKGQAKGKGRGKGKS